MPEHRYTAFVPQLLLQMQNLLTSNATNLPSSCDEELADEADEPPDLRYPYRSEGREFIKHTVRHPHTTESLLTRALLTTPESIPVNRYRGNLKRGMSTDSTWSNTSISTADLTSDEGMTSPSRCSTPSPPPPLFFQGFANLLLKKDRMETKERKDEVVDEAVESSGRKRCITFACSDKLTPQKPTQVRPAPAEASGTDSDAAPRKGCMLKFVCTQRGEDEKKTTIRSPPPRSAYGPRCTSPFAQKTPVLPSSIPKRSTNFPDHKFYEFASSVDDRSDSWTNQPIDKSRLLKVDDLLKKELDIRKLSQEAEEEALEEEEAEQDLEDADQDDEDEDEDEDEEEMDDEYDDEYDEDNDALSGNESDNEEGFASDDDDDDDQFFNYGSRPITMSPQVNRPLCCRTSSGSSIESMMRPRITPPLERRPRTPELPDSTDFVCGTFDEDKPLEEAYVSCMEERKRSKHIPTPQDIDPSFPISDPELSDDEDHSKSNESEAGFRFKTNWSGSSVEGNRKRGRRNEKVLPTRKNMSPAPVVKNRAHSPAPVRRTVAAHSPAPVRRIQSPPPKHRPTMNFQSQPGIYRTKSLPRIPGFLHRKSSRTTSTGTSPNTSTVSPVIRRRGAIDIVKGLEKKRERRQRLCKVRDGDCRAGQGVEKMRELGLEICGKGKGRTQAQWVISA